MFIATHAARADDTPAAASFTNRARFVGGEEAFDSPFGESWIGKLSTSRRKNWQGPPCNELFHI